MYEIISFDCCLLSPPCRKRNNVTLWWKLYQSEINKYMKCRDQYINKWITEWRTNSTNSYFSSNTRCLVNCGLKMNPSSRLALSAKCQDCTELTRPSYSWSLIPASQNNSKLQLDWYQDTTTSSTNSYLAIKPDTFLGSESYTLRLIGELKAETYLDNSPPGQFPTHTGWPPKNGTVDTVDFSGLALINSYLFSPCWTEHLFVIIITPRSSNLVENFLFYE